MIQKHTTRAILSLGTLLLLISEITTATMDYSNAKHNVEDVFRIKVAARIIAKCTDPFMIKYLKAASNKIDKTYAVFCNLDKDDYTELELLEMTRDTLDNKGIVIPYNFDLVIKTEDGKVIRKYANHILQQSNIHLRVINGGRIQYRVELPWFKPLYFYKVYDPASSESCYCIPITDEMNKWGINQRLGQIDTEIRRRLGGDYLLSYNSINRNELSVKIRESSEMIWTATPHTIAEVIEPDKPFALPQEMICRRGFILELHQSVCRMLMQNKTGLVYEPIIYYSNDNGVQWKVVTNTLLYAFKQFDQDVRFKYRYGCKQLLSIPVYLNNQYLTNIPNSDFLNKCFKIASYKSILNSPQIMLHPELEPFRGILDQVTNTGESFSKVIDLRLNITQLSNHQADLLRQDILRMDRDEKISYELNRFLRDNGIKYINEHGKYISCEYLMDELDAFRVYFRMSDPLESNGAKLLLLTCVFDSDEQDLRNIICIYLSQKNNCLITSSQVRLKHPTVY